MTQQEPPVVTDADRQAYVDDMVRRRGYVLPYHKAMAQADLPVLKAADALVSAAYLSQRALDHRTKELLFVLSLTVLKAERHHIASHIRTALRIGVSAQEVLEAIEIALPEAGVVAFQHGFDVWCEVVGATGVEPSADALARD
jgi:4-carboxymuconolactone decarboxylase